MEMIFTVLAETPVLGVSVFLIIGAIVCFCLFLWILGNSDEIEDEFAVILSSSKGKVHFVLFLNVLRALLIFAVLGFFTYKAYQIKGSDTYLFCVIIWVVFFYQLVAGIKESWFIIKREKRRAELRGAC